MSTVQRFVSELDTELGGAHPAQFDPASYEHGRQLAPSLDNAEEPYIPISLARRRLVEVTTDMEKQKQEHLRAIRTIEENYALIERDTNDYFRQWAADVQKKANERLTAAKAAVEAHKTSAAAARAAAAEAAEGVVAAELSRVADAVANKEATEQATERQHDAESERDAAVVEAESVAARLRGAEGELEYARTALESAREEGITIGAAGPSAEDSIARGPGEAAAIGAEELQGLRDEVRSKNSLVQQLSAQLRELKVNQSEGGANLLASTSDEAFSQQQAMLAEAGTATEKLSAELDEAKAGKKAAEENAASAKQDADLRVREVQDRLKSVLESQQELERMPFFKRTDADVEAKAAEVLAVQQELEAAADDKDEEMKKIALDLKKQMREARKKEKEVEAQLFAAQGKAAELESAQPKVGQRALYKVHLALLRTQVASQQKGMETAIAGMSTASQLHETSAVEFGGGGSGSGMSQEAADALEGQRVHMEAALAEAKESASTQEESFRAQIARLEHLVGSTKASLGEQQELSSGVLTRLKADKKKLVASKKSLEEMQKKALPRDKKALDEQMKSLKAQQRNLNLCITELTEGAETISAAAEEEHAAHEEVAGIIVSSAADIAKLEELESHVSELELEKMELSTKLELYEEMSLQPHAEVSKPSGATLDAAQKNKMMAELTKASAKAKKFEADVKKLKGQLETAKNAAKLPRNSSAAASPAHGGAARGGGGGGGSSLEDEKKLKALEKSNKLLETKLSKATDQLEMTKAKLQDAASASASGGAADAKAGKDVKKLEKQLKDVQGKQAKADEKVAKLTAELKKSTEMVKGMEKEASALKSAGAGASKELEKLREAATAGEVAAEKLTAAEAELATQMAENEETVLLLKQQTTLRKKLYNEIEDMKGKIRVIARCRPMAKYEIEKECKQVVNFKDEYTVAVTATHGIKEYTFDTVLDMKSTQDENYELTESLIQSAADGYNVCIFAYGQTGSGKTFTVVGNEQLPGILPRAMADVFQYKVDNSADADITIKVYMIELYRDNLIDIILPKAAAKNPKKLVVKKDAKGMVVIPGVTLRTADSLSDMQEIWKYGEKHRHVAATQMNAESSRSHLIFAMLIESTDKKTKKKTLGKLSLVDLAGSERASKTGATKDTLKEGQSINKSLSALGNVISALSSGADFVPYRENLLTMVMSDSLGGNAKTLMCVDYLRVAAVSSLLVISAVHPAGNPSSGT